MCDWMCVSVHGWVYMRECMPVPVWVCMCVWLWLCVCACVGVHM